MFTLSVFGFFAFSWDLLITLVLPISINFLFLLLVDALKQRFGIIKLSIQTLKAFLWCLKFKLRKRSLDSTFAFAFFPSCRLSPSLVLLHSYQNFYLKLSVSFEPQLVRRLAQSVLLSIVLRRY